MSLIQTYQQMARYNQWMTNKIYDSASALSDEELKQDRGAFFKSIHSTMNHLMWADIRWTNRIFLKDYPIKSAGMGEDIFDNFQTLKTEHAKMAEYIVDWSLKLTHDQIEGDISWVPPWGGDMIVKPKWLCISQLFNHQTHHRGQVTQMLKEIGIDVGDTDIPLTPD